MHSVDSAHARETEITKIAQSKEDFDAFQLHLQEILEGAVFKRSPRSVEFLKYIVDKAVAGDIGSLKERVIGIELFGRFPSYDTSGDAIVRVTASDVRKRLLQHYGKSGTTSEFHLTLPLGSYVPVVTRTGHGENSQNGATAVALTLAEPTVVEVAQQISAPVAQESGRALPSRNWGRIGLALAILLVGLNLGLWVLVRRHVSAPASASIPPLPWSGLFSASRSTQFITSDPNIVGIENMTGQQSRVSDYANRKYFPEPNNLTPQEIYTFSGMQADASAAEVDTPIAVRAAVLAAGYSRRIEVKAARRLRASDLQTDDNFILIGSPRSNPWTSLFSDSLDFQFNFDNHSQREFIRNVHPRANEKPQYIPSAIGWGTGDTYAVLAFVHNLDQNGEVLLISGVSAEGTEAAGDLATDVPRLTGALRKCGINPSGSLRHFEFLLHLTMMAGSPNKVEIEACHILPGGSDRNP
jgi:hypothetical protein